MGPEPMDTSAHPTVMGLHRTLDAIEAETIPKARQAGQINDQRVRARHRRKALERRAAELLPDAGIDAEDTGQINISTLRTPA